MKIGNVRVRVNDVLMPEERRVLLSHSIFSSRRNSLHLSLLLRYLAGVYWSSFGRDVEDDGWLCFTRGISQVPFALISIFLSPSPSPLSPPRY